MSSTAIPRLPSANLYEATLPAASRLRPHLARASTPQNNNRNMVDTQDVSLEQQDLIALRQAHLAIQRRRQQSQSAVCRFRALCQRLPAGDPPMVLRGSAVRVHLNPLRAWCRLRTAKFLASDVSPPATVLLFAVENAFAARVFELEGQTLINELADYQPCTLDQWATLSALASRDQLVALCQDLHDSGLICVS